MDADDGDAVWGFRDEWALAFVLLGGLGYRPKLTTDGLVGFCDGGVAFVLREPGGTIDDLRYEKEFVLCKRTSVGELTQVDSWAFDGDELLVSRIASAVPPPAQSAADSAEFIRHFAPQTQTERMVLTAAYVTYRPHLDALASQGIHAYLERTTGWLRMFADITPELYLDISHDDEGLASIDNGDGGWVVFVDSPSGYQAEFDFKRSADRLEDAIILTDAVVLGLSQVLRGRHVFLEHYDPVIGRLDPRWIT